MIKLLVLGAMLIECLSGSPEDAAQSKEKPRPAANEPTVLARLEAVVFSPSITGDSLPLDPRQAGRAVLEQLGRGTGNNDPKARIPTWGLAMQSEQSKIEVHCNEHHLFMRDGKLVSESKKKPDGSPPGDVPWKIIASPTIHMAIEQPAMISIGEPVVYLVKRPDGLFESKSSPDLAEGFSIKLTASRFEPDGIRFTGVELKMQRIVEREPVEGLALPVGKPKIDTRETSLDITLQQDRVAIIPLPQAENEPAILVFLTAQRIIREK